MQIVWWMWVLIANIIVGVLVVGTASFLLMWEQAQYRKWKKENLRNVS